MAVGDAIRRASGGRRSLDDLMRQPVDEGRRGSSVSTESPIASSAGATSRAFADRIRRVVVDGAGIGPPGELVETSSRARMENVRTWAYELGFDREQTFKRQVATGVRRGSAAHRAGLREGVALDGWSVYGGLRKLHGGVETSPAPPVVVTGMMMRSLVLGLVLATIAHAQGAHTLLTQPTDGKKPILGMLVHAQKSITLTIYEIEDPAFVQALTEAAGRGVDVRVIYNFNSFQAGGHDPNAQFVTQLKAGGVKAQPASAAYQITHQKTFTIDGATAVIMTFNLNPNYFTGTRDFGLITTDPAEVKEIVKVFEADWNAQPVSPNVASLVWSPVNSRTKMEGLINGATKTLEVYNEEAFDRGCIDALVAAAKRGVNVRFITAVLKPHGPPHPGQPAVSDSNAAQRDVLNKAGAHAKGIAQPYMHAKMILADFGTPKAKAYLGSENFSQTSLDKNRELGILLTEKPILQAIESTFNADFGN